MKLKLTEVNKRFLTAISILVGTIVGAGFLGLPYVAAKSGFILTAVYLIVIGFLILLINLSFGEIILRTKGEHQLVGFASKYLGRKGKRLMFILFNLAIISALLAYMIGIGNSLSFLIFGNTDNSVIFGGLFGFLMSYFLWGGISSLRKFEKIGVGALFTIVILIVIFYSNKINFTNLLGFNKDYFFLPFGVVLFSLMEFFSFPAIRKVLNKNENLVKKTIVIGTIIPVFFYILFSFIIVGITGLDTPEISTLAFGHLFIIFGIVTMFTSYLSLGTALQRSYILDYRNKKKISWFKSSIIPIILFLIIEIFEFFSFTTVLSIGGVFAGGLIGMMVLVIHNKAKVQGNRIPEYSLKLSRVIVLLIFLLFVGGAIMEISKIFRGF